MTTLIHPMIVHFPIALLITSVLFELLGRALHTNALREGALWLLALGLGSGVVAYLTGELAEEAAENAGIPEVLIETHETLALVTLIIFGILLVWRFMFRKDLTDQALGVYFLVAVFGLGTLAATGHFGGDLVYNHGAGVTTVHTPAIANVDRDEDD